MSDAPRPALGELARKASATGAVGTDWYTAADLQAEDGFHAADAEFIAACSPAVILQLVALAAGGAAMREALEQIAKGEGRYSRDPLTHAENTIADMKALALVALTPERPADA